MKEKNKNKKMIKEVRVEMIKIMMLEILVVV
jgi:hypothetical protein